MCRICRAGGIVTVGLWIMAGGTGCDNECDFFERCEGSVLQVCGDGPDQMFHRRIHEYPCEGLNSICKEIDDHEALCVSDPVTSCDPDTFTPWCDGVALYTCDGVYYTEPVDYPTAYVVAEDCSSSGGSCVEQESGGMCVAASLTAGGWQIP